MSHCLAGGDASGHCHTLASGLSGDASSRYLALTGGLACSNLVDAECFLKPSRFCCVGNQIWGIVAVLPDIK